MFIEVSQFAVLAMGDALAIGGIAVAILAALVMSLVVFHYGALWFQAYMSSLDSHRNFSPKAFTDRSGVLAGIFKK